ncbi:MAG: hypothetical protein V3T86_17700 [Planctomycetota bacterium]
MRDSRDYIIAALGAALVFCLGLVLGGQGVDAFDVDVLPAASAQDGGTIANPGGDSSVPPGAGKEPTVNYRPGLDGRAVPPTASDSNSNNRFVAVTSPVGSGESILFLIDSEHDQLLAYRFLRRKGLQFVAARKIDYDLKISSYKDLSEFTRDDMKRLWNKQRSKELRK